MMPISSAGFTEKPLCIDPVEVLFCNVIAIIYECTTFSIIKAKSSGR
jgi:hypothetical protein